MVVIVVESIDSFMKNPTQKAALMSNLEDALRSAGYDVMVEDADVGEITGSRLRGGGMSAFANPYGDWFLAVMVCRSTPAGEDGEDVEMFNEYMMVTEAYIPPRMKCGKLEEPALIPPGGRVFTIPAMAVIKGVALKTKKRSANHHSHSSV